MVDIDVNSLEPNSHKYKSEKAKNEDSAKKSREKISPVIKRDQVVSTKKPFSKKIAETFMTEDTKDVKSWLIMDVIIPGVKNTILDILSMMFFGEIDSRSKRNRSGRNRDDDRTNYSSYYRSSSNNRRNSYRNRDRDDYYSSNDRIDCRDIILRNRSDAERVIQSMRDRIRDLGSVSVAEMFDLLDLEGTYTDNNYGWDDERDIGIRRVSSGYLIDTTEPKYLD